MAGWIKIHRKLKDHWLWQDPIKLKWWIDILLEANHEPRKILLKGVLVECGRGQSVKSLDNWATDWRTTKKTVSVFFALLQKDGMIKSESIIVSTRITVCNYDSYQESGNTEETQSKRRVNAKVTQTTPKQEGKELKEVKKEYRPLVYLMDSEYETLIGKHTELAVIWMLDKLDNYKRSHDKKYASDYGAINSWVASEYSKQLAKGNVTNQSNSPMSEQELKNMKEIFG